MFKHKFKWLLFISVFVFAPLTVSAQATCSLIEERPYLIKDTNSVVYVTSDCTRQEIRNEDVYFSHFDSWDRLNGVVQSRINQVPQDSVDFLPLGPRKQFQRPELVKVPEENSVYLIVDRKKYRFSSENSFRKLGYNFGQVQDVSRELLNKFLFAGTLDENDKHPIRAMVRYQNENTVYKIGPNERKLPISQEDILNLRGYNRNSIALVSRNQFKYRNGVTFPREIVYSEDRSETIAREWIRIESPTFRFDGRDLQLEERLDPDIAGCNDCYQFVYSFESTHAGYGDRSGENVAQVITPHEMIVTVESGVVTNAITDEKYDEIAEEMVNNS